MNRLIEKLASRRSVTVASWAIALTLVAGVAYASIGVGAPPVDTPSKKAKTEQVGAQAEQQGEGEGVHGGPRSRNHSGCPGSGGLEGNWTHGDYVSSVARAHPGDSDAIRAAAQSDCGKVDHTDQGPADEGS